ncbi:MAG: DUF86 domain-containing protein [Candidatus Heimdallarchaeota archaeon]
MTHTPRYTRYLDKITHCKQRIKNIEEWTKEVNAIEDERTRLAIYKAAQEVVESIMDLLAMILKDAEKLPKDDYTNIQLVYEENLISKAEKDLLNEANGFRNRLVHDYNGLNDRIAFTALKRLLPGFNDLLRKVKQWIKNFFES